MNNYCTNCGKSGHNNKNCTEPITSCGIICINIKNLPIKRLETFLYNKYIDIQDFNYKNLNFLNKLYKYKDDIKFLLIQRKHSLSYIEFIRGRYNDKDINNLTYLFSLMSKSEIENIKNNEFQILWDNLWRKTARNKNFIKELNNSKVKFNYCKKNNLFDNLNTTYETPEWGFPKGRRNRFEKNLDCAIREFKEETNCNNYVLYNRINFIEEVFKGTNNIDYKHIYYLAGSDSDNIENINDIYEIGNIGWYTYDETIRLLRKYDITKIDIVNQIYFFIITVLEKTSLLSPKKSQISEFI
jgi:ADP-ribose pyrophosphatase YjhB (NUDIX family)